MISRLGRTGLVAVLLIASATTAWAGVEREDIVVLGADGRHYTSYKTLRSDLAERVLYLAPGQSPGDYLFIVPSDYTTTKLDNGATRLHFDAGSYALMDTGRFGKDKVRRADDGSYLFSSDRGPAGANGHAGKWNSPGDFDAFSYSWIVPANVDIVSYRANRQGQWRQQGRTLTWHGEHVNDLVFTIHYRVASTPTAPAAAPAAPKTPTAPETRQRTARRSAHEKRRLAPPSAADMARLNIAPSRTLDLPDSSASTASAQPAGRAANDQGTSGSAATGAQPTETESAATSIPADIVRAEPEGQSQASARTVRLASVVVLNQGRPMVTAHGHLVLDRLAARLTDDDIESVMVIGPSVTDSRALGGSAAQAARVADYLGVHGVDGDKIRSRAGSAGTGARGLAVRVNPGRVMTGFKPGN